MLPEVSYAYIYIYIIICFCCTSVHHNYNDSSLSWVNPWSHATKQTEPQKRLVCVWQGKSTIKEKNYKTVNAVGILAEYTHSWQDLAIYIIYYLEQALAFCAL